MWMLVVLAVAGVMAGSGARLLANLWLRRNLYAGFSVRRGVPELCVAAGWVVVGVANSSVVQLVSGLVVVWWCVAVSAVDVAVRRLPNSFTLPGYLVVLAGAAVAGTMWAAVVGSAMLAGLHLLMHVVSSSSLGAGDVKLALPLGAITGLAGAQVWLYAALLAPLFTVVVAVVMARRSHLPHGPSMCGAALLALVFGAIAEG
ncbi:A24 family peptidase [Rhodococcus sp. IEGM 1379]|uniref:prepilin peptidase n=1 Tax=Rhodococcus sp. IEGM 1379 TaxID=3047086 RepID=UPI0024B82B0F|nr:A24 family peptidase [Rhodococcus sp. IEGM 1379]